MNFIGKSIARLCRPRTDLLTFIVTRRSNSKWEADWADAQHSIQRHIFKSERLMEVILKTQTYIVDMYKDTPQALTLEIQYAIYPWKIDGDLKILLSIQQTADGLTARDTLWSDLQISGLTLEEIITNTEASIPDTTNAMLQWIRPFRDLT